MNLAQFLMLTGTPTTSSGSPTLVQQNATLGSASSGSFNCTLGAAVTSGNTLVMFAASSNTGAVSPPSGWTLVSSTFAGVTSGKRFIFSRAADGTEGTTIAGPTFNAGNNAFCVQEWSGSVTVTAAEGGDNAAGTGSFNVGPFAAPSASSVPAVFAMFNGANAMPAWTYPAGWTNVGPLANGSFPNRGQSIAYGAATAGAISTMNITYTGTRGNGIVVYWMGAWMS